MTDLDLIRGGFDLGEITAEELRLNDALRARAAQRVLEPIAAPAQKKAPQPMGEKIGSEELAKAMGARIIGRTSKR